MWLSCVRGQPHTGAVRLWLRDSIIEISCWLPILDEVFTSCNNTHQYCSDIHDDC